jgi:hypothetical protein
MTDKKWYRVTAQACTDLYAFVEAESEQEACEKARWHDEPDAGDYVEENDGQSGDWIVGSDPQEVTTVPGKIELELWLKR